MFRTLAGQSKTPVERSCPGRARTGLSGHNGTVREIGGKREGGCNRPEPVGQKAPGPCPYRRTRLILFWQGDDK